MELDKEFFIELEKQRKKYNLTSSGIYYLYCLKYNVDSVDVSNEELDILTKSGFLFKHKLTSKSELIFDNKEKVINIKSPIISKESGVFIKKLSKHFFKNNNSEYEDYLKTTNDPLKASLLLMFMNMFPTSNKNKNYEWNKHFNTEWDNVTLRRLSTMVLKNFNKIYNTKDIGIFLMGTYIFICESFNEKSGQYYIKNLENYFKEWEIWYNEASKLLNNPEQINQKKVTNSNTTFI